MCGSNGQNHISDRYLFLPFSRSYLFPYDMVAGVSSVNQVGAALYNRALMIVSVIFPSSMGIVKFHSLCLYSNTSAMTRYFKLFVTAGILSTLRNCTVMIASSSIIR